MCGSSASSTAATCTATDDRPTTDNLPVVDTAERRGRGRRRRNDSRLLPLFRRLSRFLLEQGPPVAQILRFGDST